MVTSVVFKRCAQWWQCVFSSQQLVGIFLTPTNLKLAHITGKYPHFCLQNYQNVALDQDEIVNGVLCQPPKLVSYITNFLAQYNLPSAQVGLILGPTLVQESWEQQLHPRGDHYRLQYADETQKINYYATLASPIAFQYQLAFMQAGLHLALITTATMASLQLLVWPEVQYQLDLSNVVVFNNWPKILSHATSLDEASGLALLGLYVNWKNRE